MGVRRWWDEVKTHPGGTEEGGAVWWLRNRKQQVRTSLRSSG